MGLMTTERPGIATAEKSIEQLAAEVRQNLNELKTDSLLERAKANLDFLATIGQDPQLRAYLERTQKEIKVCHQMWIGVQYDGPIDLGDDICLNSQGEVRLLSGAYTTEHDKKPLDGSSLQNMWDQNRNRRIIRKFAKMTPDQIIDKISSKIK